tara:strand:+ start:86 stop:367 length:282 start_codon:yes stop_codon:yes gene_type:complete
MMKFVNLKTRIVISSCLVVIGKRSEKIINILKKLEASVNIANLGTSDYVLANKFENYFEGDVDFISCQCDCSYRKLNKPEIKLSTLNYILDKG